MDLDEPNELLDLNFPDVDMLNIPIAKPKVEKVGVLPSNRVKLTTKRAVELLLQGTLKSKVCRYCLSVASPLSDLDQIMQIAGTGTLYKVTIRDMVACFHPFQTLNEPNFPRKICNKCLNRTISAYLFTQQCEQSERALRNCFEDLYNKLEKLDPLDKTKKRGRHKRNPNYNVIHTEHEKVMDYAEPIRNIVNTRSVILSDEKKMSDLECPKCWQIFTKIEDLIVHEKSHPSNMWFNCRLCGRSFVKRLQLKRHLKQKHIRPELELELEKKENFQCGTCVFSCEDHTVYLQHIEKHKFKSVLQHLVEKKMDKLCSVCLDEKPKLVELDKTVRLHGGYPGVTGDKSLYSILGSTIPDKKSYKYQELHVPHHAKVMKFAKLTKDKQPQNESLNSSESNTNQIIISNPLTISNDKFDCDEMYLFFFSDPSYYKDIGKEIYPVVEKDTNGCIKNRDLNMAVASKKEINDNISIVQEKLSEDVETIHNIDNTENVVVKRNYFNKSKPIEKVTLETPCKICWLFKKYTCKTCICNNKQSNITEEISDKKINDASNGNNNIYNRGKCKYCWIFKTSDKCDICKKIMNENVLNIANKVNSDVIIKDTNTDLQRKRKVIYEETKPKKKWDCQICLSKNVEERSTCICCEANRNNEKELIKVNLDCQHPFKIFKTDVSRNQYKDDLQYYKTFETANVHDDNGKQQVNGTINTVDITPVINTVNFEVLQYSNDAPQMFGKAYLADRKNIENTEEMDTDEDNSEILITPNPFSFIVTPNFSNITSSNITTPTNNIAAQLSNLNQSSNTMSDSCFKWNIGEGSSKRTNNTGRRIARPIRRMAYHK